MLNSHDHQRIAAAITEAESKSSGEIFCVLAHEVSNYREVPLAWAALAALVLPPLLVLAGLHRLALAGIFSSWTDDSVRAAGNLLLRELSAYAVIQAGIFLAVAIVVALPRIRRSLTPAALKKHRVRQVARHHFAGAGYKVSGGEPHILIFASWQDRRVELVAHEAIHKKVGDAVWDQAVAALTDAMKAGRPGDGFVRAIEICGAALAAHFPPDGAPRNALSNEITEI